MACVFCTNPAAAGDLIYEDDWSRVLLHPDWSPRGHAMVVAKRHAENASDLDEDEWLHLTRTFRDAERVILGATGKERAIVMKLGIQTPHLHLHLYPMAAAATRAEVFDAIDGRQTEARDERFVAECRSRLTREAR
ncbi:MAG TPA: HIT family protein [Thermoanaerobaculia bacterium]